MPGDHRHRQEQSGIIHMVVPKIRKHRDGGCHSPLGCLGNQWFFAEFIVALLSSHRVNQTEKMFAYANLPPHQHQTQFIVDAFNADEAHWRSLQKSRRLRRKPPIER